MSPLATTASKRRLADQRPLSARKKAKPSSPLDRAFTVDDFVYRPGPALRLHAAIGEFTTPRPTRASNFARPVNSNGRDPFQYLGDDEVFLIISLLPRKETEILRRVSRFWKATSEYHCGKIILLQNLPWAATQELEHLPKEAVNLEYRRQLYHYSSLQRGWATRAFELEGVYDWHLNNHALVWANGSNTASIQSLRDPEGASISSETKDIEFGLDNKIPVAISEIPYIQLTNSGDLIVLHRTYAIEEEDDKDDGMDEEYDPTRRRCPITRDKLYKISGGRVQWKLTLKGSICKPAVGMKALYFLEQFRGDSGPVFKKIDLATGVVLNKAHPPEINEVGLFVRQDQPMPDPQVVARIPTPGRKVELAQLDTSLKLVGNETIAIWSDIHRRAHVFSAATGQILMTYDRSRPTITAVGAVKPEIWDVYADHQDYNIHHARFTKYDSRSENVEYAFSSTNHSARENTLRFLDADRPVAFDLVHGDITYLHDNTRDPFTMIQIGGLEKTITGQTLTLDHGGRLEGFEDTEEEEIYITLPEKADKLERRRFLEITAPWFVGKDDFFGFVQGYLVYHNFTDKKLSLVDFWPTW